MLSPAENLNLSGHTPPCTATARPRLPSTPLLCLRRPGPRSAAGPHGTAAPLGASASPAGGAGCSVGGMTAPPPAAATTPRAAAASEPPVALEVTCIPPGTTNADLAALFGPFCAIDKAVCVFEHAGAAGGSSSGSGSALLLLKGSATADASALAAAKALDGHQLGGGSLAVRVCSSPAAWLQRALGLQVRGAYNGLSTPGRHINC